MPKIGASLGGGQQGSPQPGAEWRQPQQFAPREPVDWTAEQMRTPHPSRSQRFGRRVQPLAVTPELRERTINVKARGLGTFYTQGEGAPIPHDQWTQLPISPGLIQAIKDGNLERGPDPKDEPQRPRRHTAAE